MHVAVRLTKRAFGLVKGRVHLAFYHQFSLCRNEQIDGFATHHVDGFAGQRTGNGHFINPVGDFLHGCIGHHRRCTDDQSGIHGNIPGSVFFKMKRKVLSPLVVTADF